MHATEELRLLIRTVVDQAGLQRTQQGVRNIQQQTQQAGRSGASSLLAFGAAAGVSAKAVDVFSDFVGESIDAVRNHERITRATTASYGAQTAAFVRFANQLSTTTGFTSDAILEAAVSARTLSTNYGLSVEQTQKLIAVSADLARIRGIGIAESFERVQSAIRGEAEASEYLGLTLNDTYLTNQAMNGSLKNTFGTMTDGEKAQVRYNELLRQSAAFAGLASTSTDSLDDAMRKAGTAAHDLQVEIGELIKPEVISGLTIVADLLNLIKPQPGMGAVGGVIGKSSKEIQDAIRERVGGGGTGGFLGPGDAGVTAVSPFLTAAQRAQYAADLRRTRRMLDINELPGGGAARTIEAERAQQLARLAYLDQVDAAVREIQGAQDRQTELQREAVNLSAQEAQIKLSMLPTQERLAAAQRAITEQQIRASLAALPANQALENARAAAEHARLVLADLSQPLERRQAALRESINLQMRTLPGLELGAFEANEPGRLIGQAGARAGLEQQLFQVTQEGMLAQTTLAQETNRLLEQIAAQKTQAIQLTINMGTDQFRTDVYAELAEANAQSQTPPATQSSAVRRGGPS